MIRVEHEDHQVVASVETMGFRAAAAVRPWVDTGAFRVAVEDLISELSRAAGVAVDPETWETELEESIDGANQGRPVADGGGPPDSPTCRACASGHGDRVDVDEGADRSVYRYRCWNCGAEGSVDVDLSDGDLTRWSGALFTGVRGAGIVDQPRTLQVLADGGRDGRRAGRGVLGPDRSPETPVSRTYAHLERALAASDSNEVRHRIRNALQLEIGYAEGWL